MLQIYETIDNTVYIANKTLTSVRIQTLESTSSSVGDDGNGIVVFTMRNLSPLKSECQLRVLALTFEETYTVEGE